MLVTVCSIAACGIGSKEAPRTDQLVGDYVLTEPSRTILRKQKSYTKVPPSEISLGADGVLSVLNMPDCYTNGFGDGSNRFLSGTGRWEIERIDAGYGVTLTVEDGSSLPRGIYHGSSIEIRNKEPPFALWVSIGDPDQREHLVYKRKST